MHRLFLSFGIILLLLSCNKHLVVREVNTRNISIDSNIGPPDSLVELLVGPYRDSIEHDMSALVAVSSAPLVKGKPESKLTNLVSDILMDSGKAYCQEQNLNIQPDAAYVNYGGIRASLPQGEITVERIFELMPFENEIVLIKISGESFIRMAEKIAVRGGEGIAGMTLGIRNGKVSSLIVADKKSMFANPEERINTRLKIRDALILALSNRYKRDGIIDVKEDGRIFNEQ